VAHSTIEIGNTAELGTATMARYVWTIEYYTADGTLGDYYPGFCYSQREAERIAPKFMKELDWAASWKIRRDDLDDNAPIKP
jgi:hypothetical protein